MLNALGLNSIFVVRPDKYTKLVYTDTMAAITNEQSGSGTKRMKSPPQHGVTSDANTNVSYYSVHLSTRDQETKSPF